MDVPHKTLTRRVLLDGNLARRKWQRSGREYQILDTELPGFGLRVRSSGRAFWFVRLRRRGKERRVTIGPASKISARAARSEARTLLAQAALEGLPRRKTAQTSPLLSQFVADHWRHIARGWKPSTALRNEHAWQSMIAPQFGTIPIAEITASDVVRWRDGCAGGNECRFNRKAPGQPSILNAAHRAALVEIIEKGPALAVDGVVRWRICDLRDWLKKKFNVTLSKPTLSRELRALGYRKLSARPRHHAQDRDALEGFKKGGSQPSWQRSKRVSQTTDR